MTWISLLMVVNLLLMSQAASVTRPKESPLGNRLTQAECLAGPSNSSRQREGRRINDADAEALRALFAGEVQFSLNLFKSIYNESTSSQAKGNLDNLITSPMSIYSALLLAYFGSAGRTEEQMARVLGLANHSNKVEVVQAYKLIKFTRQLMREAGLVKYDFEMANKIYFDDSISVRDCIKDIFNEDVESVNFVSQHTKVLQDINQWVETLTHGKIRDLATPDVINSQTLMAIINAAYFKGQWASQFKAASTRLTKFVISEKEAGLVNMMFQKGNFRHTASEELQAHVLEMPYLGNDVSFFVILPEGPGGLEGTLELLDVDSLRLAMADTFPVTMEVGLPRFRYEQTSSLESTLSSMGLNELFGTSADLSAFNDIGGLHVSAATHKAAIEVNEEGSEAAAATALVALRMARPLDGAKLVCDHPFLYFIYDHLSDSILFMGVFRNPKQQ